MKAREVIKPQPRTFSYHSPWMNGKHIVKPSVAVSTKDASVARDSDIDAKWWESLLNVSNEKLVHALHYKRRKKI